MTNATRCTTIVPVKVVKTEAEAFGFARDIILEATNGTGESVVAKLPNGAYIIFFEVLDFSENVTAVFDLTVYDEDDQWVDHKRLYPVSNAQQELATWITAATEDLEAMQALQVQP